MNIKDIQDFIQTNNNLKEACNWILESKEIIYKNTLSKFIESGHNQSHKLRWSQYYNKYDNPFSLYDMMVLNNSAVTEDAEMIQHSNGVLIHGRDIEFDGMSQTVVVPFDEIEMYFLDKSALSAKIKKEMIEVAKLILQKLEDEDNEAKARTENIKKELREDAIEKIKHLDQLNKIDLSDLM